MIHGTHTGRQVSFNNPMPPERGRASRACDACRKQKTRCYESGRDLACLRCARIGQQCSLEVDRATSVHQHERRLNYVDATQSHGDAR